MPILRKQCDIGNVHNCIREEAKVSGEMYLMLVHDRMGQLERGRSKKQMELQDGRA